jgi:antitoxin component of MazEF toxin-antitoxin module
MRLQVVEIGNSKGIRIPQAILKQVHFGTEVELDVTEGKIVLRRMIDPDRIFGFETIAKMDDLTIKRMLRKVNTTDLIIGLIDVDKATKEAVLRNLTEQVRNYVRTRVIRLEKGNARDLIIERSRNMISEAFIEMMRE